MIQRTVVYTLMTTATVGLVTALVLVMLGYRFNRESNTIQQGGLVQFISRPNGATITVGQAELANKTPNKVTINPGSYEVSMQREGYLPWTKQVSVQAGRVLWLNYAQLVPETIETSSVATLGAATQAVASPNSRYFAYTTSADPFVLRVIDTRSSQYETTNVSLSETSESGAQNGVTIREWSSDSQRMLLSRKRTNGTAWLYTEATKSNTEVNLSSTYDVSIRTAMFDPRSHDRVIIQTTDGDVRIIDTANQSISTVLVNRVDSFSLIDSKDIVYVRTNLAKQRKVGYLTLGKTVGRELPISDTTVSRVAGVTYFATDYIAITTKTRMVVYRMNDLPSSDSDTPITASIVSSQSIDAAPTNLSWQGNGRFSVVEYAGGFNTFDNELLNYSSTKFSSKQNGKLRWLDGYHAYYFSAKALQVVEFDGANSYSINQTRGLAALLTNDGKYIYSVAKQGDTFKLLRSQMILN